MLSHRPVAGVWLPHAQVHQDLVELLHPQVPLVLCVSTQPVPAGTREESLCVSETQVTSLNDLKALDWFKKYGNTRHCLHTSNCFLI